MSRSLSSTRLGPVDSSETSGLLPPSARMAESLEAMVSLFTWLVLDERMLRAKRRLMDIVLYVHLEI